MMEKIDTFRWTNNGFWFLNVLDLGTLANWVRCVLGSLGHYPHHRNGYQPGSQSWCSHHLQQRSWLGWTRKPSYPNLNRAQFFRIFWGRKWWKGRIIAVRSLVLFNTDVLICSGFSGWVHSLGQLLQLCTIKLWSEPFHSSPSELSDHQTVHDGWFSWSSRSSQFVGFMIFSFLSVCKNCNIIIS